MEKPIVRDPQGRSKWIVLAISVSLAACGLIGELSGTMVPAERLTRLGADRQGLTRFGVDTQEAEGLLRRARILGAAYLAASLAVLALRRPMARALGAIARSAAVDFAALGRWFVDRARHGEILELVLATAVGVAVRAPFLDCPMELDESFTYFRFIKKGPIFTLFAYNTNNHLLVNLLGWLGNTLFGTNPVSQRLGSFLAGCLLVPLSYLAARAIWNRGAAVIAAAIVATFPYLVYYSVHARGYSLLLCCYAGCLALCPHLRRTNSPAGWVGFAALAALGLFSVPVMVYPLITTAVWILAIAPNPREAIPARQFLGHAVAAACLTAFLFFVLYTPSMIGEGLTAVIVNEMSVSGLTWTGWIEGVPGQLPGIWANAGWPFPSWVVPGILALILIEILFFRHRALSPSPVLVAFLTTPVVLFLQRLHPMPRVLIHMYYLAILGFSAGASLVIALIWKQPTTRAYAIRIFAACAAIVLMIPSLRGAAEIGENRGGCRDAREMAAFLRTIPPEDHIMLSGHTSHVVPYYFLVDGYPSARISGKPGFFGPVWIIPPEHWEERPGPNGSIWFVTDENFTLAEDVEETKLSPHIAAGLKEYKRFRRGGCIYLYKQQVDSE